MVAFCLDSISCSVYFNSLPLYEITKITYDSLNVKSNEVCQKDQNVTEKMICLHQPEKDCFFGRGSEFILSQLFNLFIYIRLLYFSMSLKARLEELIHELITLYNHEFIQRQP